MRRVLAGTLTIVLMGCLLWSASRQPASPTVGSASASVEGPSPSSGAESCLRTLLESAARGDVASYLACFSGPLARRLEREVDERGRDAFAQDLRAAARSRKSHAIFAGETEPGGAVRVAVESVYPDRNERQTYRLERVDERWLVTDVETVRGREPKTKYGAPASYEQPEGIPVQGGISIETGSDPDAD